ncbi:MAG: magnesium transporter [Vulcanimicrobiota bacterium]
MTTSPRTLIDEAERREGLVEELLELAEEQQLEQVVTRLRTLHPADQAEILEEFSSEVSYRLLKDYPDEEIAEILEFLSENARTGFVSHLDPAVTARILVFVDDDLAADLVEELPDEQVEALLNMLDDPTGIKELLELPEESAGRWMSPDVIALQEDWTVQQAFEHLRKESPDADQPFYLYTVDREGRLMGVVDLRRLITAPPDAPLMSITIKEVLSVPVEMDQEAAAERLRYYDLLALPVVNNEGHLMGVLTADDVLDVQVEEATEDIYLQVGLDAESSALSTVGRTLRRRAPWLLINLLIGFFSALIVSSFEGTISKVAALAAFMPIIAGHGGNTGCQTTTLVVRGLALGEIYKRDVSRLVAKELGFGIIYGLLAGVLTGGLAFILTHNHWLAGVVFFAMVGNIVVAGLAGSLIPLGLRALKIDPALASTVWLTTFTDWVGFFLLLGLGTYLIGHLT